MAASLVAADFGWLVPIIVVFVWALGKALEHAQENKEVPRPRRPQQQLPPRKDPQKELEVFLKELGLEKPGQRPAPAKPPAAARAPQRVPAKPPPQPQPPKPRKRPVRQQHLESEISTRHQETVHSRLEQEHLKTHVAQHTVVAAELREPPPPAAPPAPLPATPAARATGVESALGSLLHNRTMLSRAFILGQVLGAPIALQDDPIGTGLMVGPPRNI